MEYFNTNQFCGVVHVEHKYRNAIEINICGCMNPMI